MPVLKRTTHSQLRVSAQETHKLNKGVGMKRELERLLKDHQQRGQLDFVQDVVRRDQPFSQRRRVGEVVQWKPNMFGEVLKGGGHTQRPKDSRWTKQAGSNPAIWRRTTTRFTIRPLEALPDTDFTIGDSEFDALDLDHFFQPSEFCFSRDDTLELIRLGTRYNGNMFLVHDDFVAHRTTPMIQLEDVAYRYFSVLRAVLAHRTTLIASFSACGDVLSKFFFLHPLWPEEHFYAAHKDGAEYRGLLRHAAGMSVGRNVVVDEAERRLDVLRATFRSLEKTSLEEGWAVDTVVESAQAVAEVDHMRQFGCRPLHVASRITDELLLLFEKKAPLLLRQGEEKLEFCLLDHPEALMCACDGTLDALDKLRLELFLNQTTQKLRQKKKNRLSALEKLRDEMKVLAEGPLEEFLINP